MLLLLTTNGGNEKLSQSAWSGRCLRIDVVTVEFYFRKINAIVFMHYF
jgi:hypothetical protein